MGTPIHPIVIVPGTACNLCWGDGKDFDLPTPKFVTMSFHDWSEGPLWHEGLRAELSAPVILENSIPFPCLFGGVSEHFNWSWESQAGGTIFTINDKPPGIGWCLAAVGAPPCQLVMDNQLGAPIPRYTEDGYGSILFGS